MGIFLCAVLQDICMCKCAWLVLNTKKFVRDRFSGVIESGTMECFEPWEVGISASHLDE